MLIFLDLETTGLEAKDKIVSIGLIAVGAQEITTKYDLVYEGKKISPKASSINHITNEMLKNKPKLQESEAYKFLCEYNLPTTTLVSHNIKYNLQMLLACGFTFLGNVIDTLRVSKHLIPECEGYSLQLLRYELKLYKSEKAQSLACAVSTSEEVLLGCAIENVLLAHHALHDAVIVKILYEYLLESATKEEMTALSFKNVLMQKFEFGKYSGRYIEEISVCDRGYLEWMLANILDLNEDLKYSIDYYLQANL
ncbi:MAG: DNA polymerase III subunit epsilon [Helicobacteraceae bacterium CG2_30_36_10]|nr:MAG: DNA polymerase III subunit epsilon [Helicobacteraceae bacterium CG2_30_36_10]